MKTFSDMLKISESEQILIDSKTNIVTFPSRVKILKDKLEYNAKTKSAIYIISSALKMKSDIEPKLYYESNGESYEVYFGGVVCVNKTESEVIGDITYAINLVNKGIKEVYFCTVDFNESGNYFSSAIGKMDTRQIIYNNGIRAFKDSIKERVVLMKAVKEFNKKLQTLKRFTFNFGNAFGGIKKLAINFDGDILIKSNSGRRIDFTPTKEEVLAELELFCLPEWNSKYNSNPTPTLENAWTITLKLDGEELEFTGLDDYPKTWQFVEYFIKKYGGFEEIKE
ncbi:MAG: hypothetical protein IKV61_03220 [Clostridia bacterium]|nr:hypothetical protein [Clostridia bacterium]